MLPAQRRQELQQLAVHRLAGLDQPLGGAFQVHRVPQHDSRRHQVEVAGPVALLLEAPMALLQIVGGDKLIIPFC